MELNLEDKLVLVTGSTFGIGKAIAIAFVKAKSRVIVNGRKKDAVDATVLELEGILSKEKGRREIYGIVGDVGDLQAVTSLEKEIAKIGPVDVLICNVGIFETKPFETITDEEWMHYFNVNVLGTVRLCRSYLPQMIERSKKDSNWFGRVVIIASDAGVKPLHQMIHYSVTKSAQIGLARALAELTKGTNVTVNSILAGPTWTEGVENYMVHLAQDEKTTVESLTKNYFSSIETTSLINRYLKPEEIANTVLFLSSSAASAINGASQRSEGGLIRHT